METLGVIGIFVAIIAIIILAVKGLNIVVAAPLATMIVILTNEMDIFGSLIGSEPSYMTGLAGFLINNFAIFLLGSILAQYMDKSNATVSIANYILDKVGTDSAFKVLLAIAVIAAILTYGGISLFVVMFALVPLSRPIFKRLNINWSLFPIPLSLGMATFTMSMLPGTPSIQNAVPTTTLGTSLTAAPVLSLIGTVVITLFGLGYMRYALNKSLNNGETFYSYMDSDSDEPIIEEEPDIDDDQLPSIIVSILPIVTLILIILIFSQVDNIILIALTVAIIMSAIIYHTYIPSQVETLNNGANGAVPSAFATSSSVAFGSVLTSAPSFAIIRDAILNIPGNPLVGLSVAAALLGGITGSASGAIGIVMENFAQLYIDMGIHPELIHRITVVAAAVITAVPHSGVTITISNLTGLSIMKAFKHQFVIVNGGHLVALIVMLLVSGLLY